MILVMSCEIIEEIEMVVSYIMEMHISLHVQLANTIARDSLDVTIANVAKTLDDYQIGPISQRLFAVPQNWHHDYYANFAKKLAVVAGRYNAMMLEFASFLNAGALAEIASRIQTPEAITAEYSAIDKKYSERAAICYQIAEQYKYIAIVIADAVAKQKVADSSASHAINAEFVVSMAKYIAQTAKLEAALGAFDNAVL